MDPGGGLQGTGSKLYSTQLEGVPKQFSDACRRLVAINHNFTMLRVCPHRQVPVVARMRLSAWKPYLSIEVKTI